MTTPTRDELSAFPCNPLRPESRCQEQCPGGDSPCERRDIYREHIALRKAVLGDMPPRVAREIYQGAGERCERASLYTATERIRAIIAWVEGL